MKLSIDQAVYQLLHHQSYRDKFLKSEYAPLNLSDQSLSELETIDKEQLKMSAQQIAQRLLSGNHQGGHGLKGIFSDTFSAWELHSQQSSLDLIYQFLETEYFNQYHELPFVGPGHSIEQAFYEFMSQRIWSIGHPLEGIVRNEFLMSIFKSIASAKELNFILDPKYIKKNQRSCYSVQTFQFKLVENQLIEQPHFVVYASRQGQYISGEITSLIADLLFDEKVKPIERMSEIIKRHGVSLQTFLTTYQQMVQMGLLDAYSV